MIFNFWGFGKAVARSQLHFLICTFIIPPIKPNITSRPSRRRHAPVFPVKQRRRGLAFRYKAIYLPRSPQAFKALASSDPYATKTDGAPALAFALVPST